MHSIFIFYINCIIRNIKQTIKKCYKEKYTTKNQKIKTALSNYIKCFLKFPPTEDNKNEGDNKGEGENKDEGEMKDEGLNKNEENKKIKKKRKLKEIRMKKKQRKMKVSKGMKKTKNARLKKAKKTKREIIAQNIKMVQMTRFLQNIQK
ncbi:hypothetical protein TTHERM_00383590 (macronuclear) [Tetrahymena thermophila SB210]|uniref:Uncharacterized protein n=1 Tax=Tetrahymena thermophila (strain SB210) TaxID=312017 RepID=Q23F54_TETTS|nr:hypothetical protein TTHERM_00383590 [Tetrahymena thermophila SB210]EAR95299.2 hypothetical protein TTHERM_00383590 [Tetrahymena thermophila SB210]|eukprot:XP_001015544.2 hypothetical protein TTHERM_00383590 [Tetrahymena thermophila SB210]